MRKSPVSISIFALFLIFGSPLSHASEQSESNERALIAAVSTLDHFMQAGLDKDAQRGAKLLAAFETNAQKAVYNTRRLFRKEQGIFYSYKSISSDLYGYDVRKNALGTSVLLEGGIETEKGISGEFSAMLIYRRNQWLISSLAIN